MNLSQYSLTALIACALTLSVGCSEEPTETTSTTTTTSTTSTTSTTTGNQIPYSIAAYILPTSPDVGDTLTCIVDSPLIDPDGDPVTVITNWTVNGADIEVAAANVSAPNFAKDDVVACIVTPNDGIENGPSTTTEPVVIINSAPTVEKVVLTPGSASVSDAIYCDWTFVDPDSDADQSTVSWAVNSVDVSTETVLSGSFQEDDVVSCTVTPSDGELSGPEKSASLVVGNTAPSITSVSITPNPATVTDTLSCSYEGYSDPDLLDKDYTTYSWSVDGVEVGTNQTIDNAFNSGDEVSCTVTPYDGTDIGAAALDTITISNTAPILEAVTLGPDIASELDTLICSPGTVIDPDEPKKLTYTYAWEVNGSAIVASSNELDGADFNSFDVVTCTASVSDGEETSETVASNAVTIQNSAPSIGLASITPEPALATDTLLCAWSDFQDVDGDDDLSTNTWTVNGVEVGTSTTLASVFVGGDEITCVVIPNDGNEDGAAVSHTLIVENSLPSIDSVEITPEAPTVTDDLTCSYSNYQDADGNTDSSTYEWMVNGVSTGADSTLLAGAFFGGDTVTCTVTPHDGLAPGVALDSAVTIGNTPPVLSSVSLSPENPSITDLLSCELGATTDEDGTLKFSYEYQWTVNGIVIGASDTTLSSDDFSKNDEIFCTVTPNDGSADGEAISSNTVTAVNTLPTIESVTVTPLVATASDTLSCAWSGFSDIDGDTDASTITWTVNGAIVGTGTEMSGEFFGGDTVTCAVTPTDDEGANAPILDSITIENTAPALDGVTVSPDPAYTNSILSCLVGTTTDIDGTTSFTYVYSWEVNGLTIGETGATLDPAQTTLGDSINCSATPDDGTDLGVTMTSADVSVINSAPVVGTVSITPDPAYSADDLTCNANDINDADGTTVFTLTYAWTVNGVLSPETSMTLSSDDTIRNDAVVCNVTANDGTESSATVASNTHIIQNSLPSVATVSVTPATAYAGDTLTCTYAGFTDADNDSDNSTIAWRVDGLTIGSAPTLSTGFGNGDEVVCTVTANDGIDPGSTASDSATIQNTAPVLNSVSLVPVAPTTNSTVTAVIDATDADEETLTFSYLWRVNGLTIADTGSTISGTTAFDKGDVIEVEVTATDGFLTTASLTASPVTVGNTRPNISSTSIDPNTPLSGVDDLICQANGLNDADGDPITVSYSWRLNGSNYLGAVQQSVDPGDTISGINTSNGDTWQCSTVADDGTDISATSTASVTVISGAACAALYYAGDNAFPWDRVTIPEFDELDGGSFATIEAWVNPESATDDGVVFTSDFMACSIAGDPAYGPNQNKWRCTADDVELFSTNVATIGDWSHIALQFRNGLVSIYIDGTNQGSAMATSSTVGTLGDLQFGYAFGSATNAMFMGLIDEVRVSDVARYTAPTTPETRFTPDGDTNALWHFDEGTGSLTEDATGNGWDGTIYSALWTSQSTCDI